MKVIETLDTRKGFGSSFLWPLPEEDASEEASETLEAQEQAQAAKEPTWEDQPVKDKLVTALTYLRQHHSYCIHCGCQVPSALLGML